MAKRKGARFQRMMSRTLAESILKYPGIPEEDRKGIVRKYASNVRPLLRDRPDLVLESLAYMSEWLNVMAERLGGEPDHINIPLMVYYERARDEIADETERLSAWISFLHRDD